MRQIKQNQKKLCEDVYNNIIDTLNANDAYSADIRRQIVFFLSHLRNDRLIRQLYMDVKVIVRHFGKIALFDFYDKF